MSDNDAVVLVVGAGPVGLTAARLLANTGTRCIVVDRRDGPQRSPAAHVVNGRTLEIFAQAGLDMNAIAALASDPADAGHVNFVTRLNGSLIGRLPFERQGDECRHFTPYPLRNISQHHLEPWLSGVVAAMPEVELYYDTEWVSAEQHEAGVRSVLRDVRTGEVRVVSTAYVLGADGAGSAVRRWLGVEMVGPAGLQSFVTIHFLANLRRYVDHRPGVLHFVMDPAARGCLVAHDIDREWVFMHSFNQATESIDDFDHDRCGQLVRAAIGDPDADVSIVGTSTWHMSAQVAERMRDGRVFLVGDAAHRFPPTGGMGLNTGVGDVHNLVWKLVAVEAGWAAPTLLDTYQSERRPIAEINCQQSLTNAFKMVLLAQALGLSPATTSSELEATLADPARAIAIAEAVAEQATHFNMLGLQLGYRYQLPDSPPAPTDVDPSVFAPQGEVGSRLPHGWVDADTSTLQLIGTDRLTLVSVGAHREWADALEGAGAEVHHVQLELESWRQQCGLGTTGAMLIRPDQHIAWTASELPTDPSQAVRAAARHALM